MLYHPSLQHCSSGLHQTWIFLELTLIQLRSSWSVTLMHLTFGRFCFYFRSLASCWPLCLHSSRVPKWESWHHYRSWHSDCSGWSLILVSYVWPCRACAHNHRRKIGHILCCEQFHRTCTMDTIDQADLGMKSTSPSAQNPVASGYKQKCYSASLVWQCYK